MNKLITLAFTVILCSTFMISCSSSDDEIVSKEQDIERQESNSSFFDNLEDIIEDELENYDFNNGPVVVQVDLINEFVNLAPADSDYNPPAILQCTSFNFFTYMNCVRGQISTLKDSYIGDAAIDCWTYGFDPELGYYMDIEPCL